MSRVFAAVLALGACSVEPDAQDDDETENGDPTDGDEDSDAPPIDEPSPLDGAWEGECVGDVVITYTTTTTYTYAQPLDLAGILTLDENVAGIVAGELAFTLTYAYTTTTETSTDQGVLLVAGSREGQDVHLDFLGYTSTFDPGSTEEFPAWIELTLDGDTLDGAIVFTIDTYDQLSEVPCHFTRM
jgi:hypothetical protein